MNVPEIIEGKREGRANTPEEIRAGIRAIRGLTDRPFGVNLLLAPPELGNADVAGTQRFLDRLRSELGLSPGDPNVTLPPSRLREQVRAVLEEHVPVLSVGRFQLC